MRGIVSRNPENVHRLSAFDTSLNILRRSNIRALASWKIGIGNLTWNSVSVEERYFIAKNQMYSDLEKLERSAEEADRMIGIADQKGIIITLGTNGFCFRRQYPNSFA